MHTQWAVSELKHGCNFNTRCSTDLPNFARGKGGAVHGVFCLDRNKQAALVWVRAGFSKTGRMWCFCLVKKQLSQLLRFSVEKFRTSPRQTFLESVCHDGSARATVPLFCSSGSHVLLWSTISLRWLLSLWSWASRDPARLLTVISLHFIFALLMVTVLHTTLKHCTL